MKVAVIGGGVAGLTVAYDLTTAGIDVSVFEAQRRWGGKIFSSPVGDRLADAGPDNFLARVPDATELCVELGLEDRLTVPASPEPAYVYRNGDLHPLPGGTVLGVPTDFGALAASGLISPAGLERAERDLTLEPTPLDDTTTVGEYCRARLGAEVTEMLIDPLVGGINASSIDHLALADGAAQLYAAARRHPSIVQGLRRTRADIGPTLGSAGRGEPVFHGLEGGMATLIEALVSALDGRADLRLGFALDGLPEGFDHVVIATEAHAAARLLAVANPDAAALAARIRHASVAQVTVEIPAGQIEPLDASGILVPRAEGFLMTACTWFSTKWAQYARDDAYLVRITSGRFGDDRAIGLPDDELIERLVDEFTTVYADPGPLVAVRIVRWPDAFPQYEPGHRRLVDSLFDALAPGQHLVGNSYRGIGIPATIGLARATAAAIAG